ncbi:MAG TPA: hypothetical protein VNZ52_14905, partial [Candidatus Thermoplasmatota archaeon]|nr:hypothetical protein [Candidatus Thermoplasmatota archaeon]
MTLAHRGSQAAFLLAALCAFLAGGAFAPRALFSLSLPGVVSLVGLLAGAGLAAYAVERGSRLLLVAGAALLLLGALDSSTIELNGWAVAFAAALVTGVELAFGHFRASRVTNPEARGVLLVRYLRDLRVALPLTLAAVVAGAGLFLVAGALLPDAFAASLERLSPFGIVASGLLVGALVVAYGLTVRALRRRRTVPTAPISQPASEAAPAAA